MYLCFSIYLKSFVRYKFLILDTYHLDTIYMGKDVVIFQSQKESVSVKVQETLS